MRVRKLIKCQKDLVTSTSWSHGKLTKRHAPVFEKTRPIRAGWQWRSGKATNQDDDYVLLALCNPGKDNWKAILMAKLTDGWSTVARLEYHASHPGLHVHSDCRNSGLQTGPPSMDIRNRIPKTDQRHLRIQGWTCDGFWNRAMQFFKISDPGGSFL